MLDILTRTWQVVVGGLLVTGGNLALVEGPSWQLAMRGAEVEEGS